MVRPRKAIADALRPELPAAWLVQHWKPTEINIQKPAVFVTQDEVARLTSAPQGANDTTLTVVVVEPTRDPATCDDRLEDNLDLVLNVLDRVRTVRVGTAKRVVTDTEGGFPAYEIPVTLATTRER